MIKHFFLLALVLMTALVIIPTLSSAQAAQSSPHIQIYSTYGTNNEELFVPVNSSGINVYPDWHIYLYGSGAFTFSVNGTVEETGVSVNSINFTYDWNLSGGSQAEASLTFGATTYTFHDIITGPLSNRVIVNVQVLSFMQGQHQFLTVQDGTQGALMYPDWTVTMESTSNVSYSIYVNSQEVLSGSIYGTKIVHFNVTGTSVTVTVGIGTSIFKYPNELVASIPIDKYYGPKPAPLAYTVQEYEYGIARAFVASLFAILVSILSVRKWVIEREKREVHVL